MAYNDAMPFGPILTNAYEQYRAARQTWRPLTEFRITPEHWFALLDELRDTPAGATIVDLRLYTPNDPPRLFGVPVIITNDTDVLTQADIPWKRR